MSTVGLSGKKGGDTTLIDKNDAANGITAYGGGGGGAYEEGGGTKGDVHCGSGGGGSRNASGADRNGGAGSAQGKKGGTGNAALYGGGGGGAGEEGYQAKTAGGGKGGKGKSSSISGKLEWYAGGGGGGYADYMATGAAIAGGEGGGGAGGYGASVLAEAGKPGTGGGGGGADGGMCNGAKGGSGIVIVRISGALAGGLEKPTDIKFVYDGNGHTSYVTCPFYEVTGTSTATNVGVYAVTVTPRTGIKWADDDSGKPVSVTMTIYDEASKSDTALVSGYPVSYYGAADAYWDGGELVLKFTGAGSFTLPGSTKASLLAVGGGGGGGGEYFNGYMSPYGGAGGGGGGGFVETNMLCVGGTYAVGVGQGGEPGLGGMSTVGLSGKKGGDTIILTNACSWVTAYGGGGGGAYEEGGGTKGDVRCGSGGGGSRNASGADRNGGAGSAQGKKGGTGNAALYGGGGGGAGEEGYPASTPGGGKGGKGKSSSISGKLEWYAGGGGGGYADYMATGAAIPGGEGGGGAGGYGASVLAEAGKPGTGGGGGGADGGMCNGAKGGSGVVYVRISATMEGELVKPEKVQKITYDGNAHTTAVSCVFFDVSGTNIATEVGTYPSKVTLKDGVTWLGGDPESPVDITLTISPVTVTLGGLAIDSWDYGAGQTGQAEKETVPEPTCTVSPDWVKAKLIYEYALTADKADPAAWSTEKPTAAGDYTVRVRTPDTKNYAGTTSQEVAFKIRKRQVEFANLKIRDWMLGTPEKETPNPTCTVTPAWVKPVYTYATQAVDSVEWIWSDEKPTTLGTHKLHAALPDLDNLELKAGSMTDATFKIIKGLGNLFTDYVEITVSYDGTEPAELTNFPYRLALSETAPVGFKYDLVGKGGEEMAFTDADGNEIYPYEVDTWQTNGVSIVYVKLPHVDHEKQTIRLYWNLRYGATAPAHNPDAVWSDWTEEDYAKLKKLPGQAFDSPVYHDGYLVNYWVKQPAMSSTFWDATDSAEKYGKITQDAVSRFDSDKVVRVITNLVTGATYAKLPTQEAGTYRVSYVLDDPDMVYVPMEAHVDFTVIGHNPWDDLKGDARSLTLSGRVMLANDDKAPGHEVSDQGYWQTREVKDTSTGKTIVNDVFWTHEGTREVTSRLPNLLEGRNHTLSYIGADSQTNVLWRFEDVMFGNIFRSDGLLLAGQAELPWSSTSMGVSTYAKGGVPASQAEVSHIVMCNTKLATVYSPCYTNGIGTIYFDVVNAWTEPADAPEPFRIVVEVATQTDDGLPPTDENAEGGEGTLGKITGERWVAYPMLPLVRDNNQPPFVPQAVTNDLSLNIKSKTTTNNFYRVCVNVEQRCPVRFRIRRVSAAVNYYEDTSNLILLDNIVVSYPRMTAEITALGHFDPELMGNRTLGQEGAMMRPYPSVTDESIIGRGVATTYVNGSTNANPGAFIGLTKMHYRWHYLNQASNDWATVDLSPGNGFVAAEPLTVPRREGDVEWWYESFLNMPYYEYYDYSGSGAGLKGAGGKPLYTEERTVVTNRSDNWFFRFRRGKSDLETVRIFSRTTDDEGVETEETSDMELVRDGVWRGYLRTPKALEDGIRVRFETVNRQTPGATAFVTNTAAYAFNAETDETGKVKVYAAGSLVPASTNDWTTVACDATTGYLLFQLEEKTMGMSVVHADYQNFNRWSDANKPSQLFVGTSTDTNSFSMSGSSEVTREFRAALDWWRPSIATNDLWSESFVVPIEEMREGGAYELFKPFSSARLSPNGFTVGSGQWVSGYYRAPNEVAGMALQMEGRGKGYIQFVNAAEAPRGIESISFSARLGQFIEFDDFSYFDGDVKSKMTNYTFMARAAFDLNQNTTFSGNASLSLVAFYRPGSSCYEFRIEQYNATYQSGKVTGVGPTKLLSLYRWRYDDASGEVKATKLGTYELNNANVLKTNGESGSYGLMFISVNNNAAKNYTEICAGVSTGGATRGTTTGTTCRWISYVDSDEERLKNGTYGVLSANCPGRFVSLMSGKRAQTIPSTNKGLQNKEQTFNFPGTSDRTWCQADIADDNWAIRPRRAKVESTDNPANCCIVARAVEQPVVISIAKPGTTDWKTLMTTNVNSFGALASPIVVNLWDKNECSLQVSTGGNAESARNDIVIDDLEIRQWRGESYDGKEGSKYFPDVSYGSPTNFVFTQTWILESADGATNCQLSAKRSLASEATSIRSPLMDGKTSGGYKRGSGLGMFSFSYANAQTNVNLLLQIATNGIDSTTLPSISRSVKPGDWTTVTNYSFAGLSKEELASGTRSYYFGLHGVTGAMRIVMDPEVVNAVSNTTDTSAFGSIDITSVLCRDEPTLDRFSWWGWNLRTTNDKMLMNVSDVERVETENGLSAGLNNSVERDIVEADRAQYPKHLPFIQTPTFDSEVVGEVCFKARKYGADDPDTRVTLFGAKSGLTEDEKAWTKLKSWTVDNATFAAHNDAGDDYTFKTAPGDSYCAFRFAVTGVEGVTNPMTDPDAPAVPQRVLIDEILVQEAIRSQVSFRNVAAFRSNLDTLWPITNIMSRSEQPLCKESWGVQAEVYASQLAEEVDLSTAKVRLWWYESDYPWGFEKWRTEAKAQNAWLSPCQGTNLVYRSSYFGSTGSVMPPQDKPKTVQYTLEVVYKTSRGEPVTNWLSKADWVKPPWYDPVDYNADYGDAEGTFSAYTILDTVSPGWAWINEANVFDTYDWSWNNSDRFQQFIEIAAPSDADLSNWKVRFLDAQIGANRIVTNEVAVFGVALPGLKKGLKGIDPDSGCVFHVLGSPKVLENVPSALDAAQGEVDGYWRRPDNTSQGLSSSGEIQAYYPVTVQLVRPSGIIEHEVTAIGTNYYYDTENYQPENHAAFIEAHERGTRKIPVIGADERGSEAGQPRGWSRALGVFAGNGETFMQWNNVHTMTPGKKNEGQVIDPNCPHPHGSSIVVYAILEGGHLEQSVGGLPRTNETVTVLCQKGGEGTNIVYTAAPWYQLGAVTTNGIVTFATETNLTARTYALEVGRGASNDVTVVARAEIDENLVNNYGLGPDNRYRDAIMKWLEGGCDLYGNSWANPGSGVVLPAQYWPYSGNSSAYRDMSLTEMYWLDIDPTEGDWILKAGFVEPARPQYDYDNEVTNVRMSVYMMISNKNENASWSTDAPHKMAHAPYALRGLKPGSSTQDYSLTSPDPWTSVTFKITGFMNNGLQQISNPTNWVPLRWFGFHANSFWPRGDAHEFQATIDVRDPYSKSSPAYSYGYYQWWLDHKTKPVIFFGWTIDERLKPITVDVLTPNSTY